MKTSCEFTKSRETNVTLVIEPVGTIFTIVDINQSFIEGDKNKNLSKEIKELRFITS